MMRCLGVRYADDGDDRGVGASALGNPEAEERAQNLSGGGDDANRV